MSLDSDLHSDMNVLLDIVKVAIEVVGEVHNVLSSVEIVVQRVDHGLEAVNGAIVVVGGSLSSVEIVVQPADHRFVTKSMTLEAVDGAAVIVNNILSNVKIASRLVISGLQRFVFLFSGNQTLDESGRVACQELLKRDGLLKVAEDAIAGWFLVGITASHRKDAAVESAS